MLGLIFTCLFEHVEEKHGYDAVEHLIGQCKLTDDGAYTSSATYPDGEFVDLMRAYADYTSQTMDDALFEVGKVEIFTLLGMHPQFEGKFPHPIDIIKHMDSDIHPAVTVLYPDTKLPMIQVLNSSENAISLVYRSDKNLYTFMHGILSGLADYFKFSADISYRVAPDKSAIFDVSLSKIS